MKKLVIFLAFTGWVIHGFSLESRNILQQKAKEIELETSLIQDFSEINLPTYDSRDFWKGLPSAVKDQYVEKAEGSIDYDWPVVKATDFIEIIRSGDRRQSVYGAPRAALMNLVMGELVEGKGRFIDQIINGVWYYSEQTWWGWSAHLPSPKGLPDIQKPSIDLGVGEIANILSWTWYLFKDEFDKIHPLISKRLRDEIMYKAVEPYYEREDFWWMGFDGSRSVNNWNPWTNHNLLTAILIMEDDPVQKIKGVKKVIRSLDVFLNQYPEDGGCDEGPSYWGRAGASLYQNLDLLRMATRGKFDVFDHPLIQNMGSYIYKAYINYPYFINFADADATTGSRPQIIYSYGKDIKDPVMQNFGAYLAHQQGWGNEVPGGKVDEQLIQLVRMEEIKMAKSKNALIKDFWLPNLQVGGARDHEGSTEGFFFAAKGGHNAESHNHNDLGTCVMYYNGKPCLIDLGRETYVAKTFSSRRYEIWTMQSQYHSLPKINGVDQMQGRKYVAKNTTFSADNKTTVFSTDIANAYTEGAKVKSWMRTYTLERGKAFRIRDQYELDEVKDETTTLNLITYNKVTHVSDGVLHLKGDGFALSLEYDPDSVVPDIQFNEVTDKGLKRYWPEGVTRIIFTFKEVRLKGMNELVIKELK